MDTTTFSLLPDDDLAVETRRAARAERHSTAYLIRLLIEVERRALHLSLGYSSMFVYCTRALLMSEQAAYSRITAARAVRRHPEMLTLLERGDLTLSSVGLLAPHVTDENVESLLEGAKGKSSRDVERMIASLNPQPDIPTTIRALPMATAPTPVPSLLQSPAAGCEDAVAGEFETRSSDLRVSQRVTRPTIAPLSRKRFLLRVTISEATQDKLRRLQSLLRHDIPSGDEAEIIDRALTSLLQQTERRKLAATPRPRSGAAAALSGRSIPASVRRSVWARDDGRCAFIGSEGRCDETGFLEFHHVVPFAAGGPTTVENLQLRCRAHNQYEAVMYFGADPQNDVSSTNRK